jgi:lipopolysaccharide export system permease protein
VQVPALSDIVKNLDAQPSRALYESTDKVKRAELHWRIALPVMCIVLTFVAVPISRLNPRQGRYARFLPAIVLYFVYSNLVSAAKVWIARGTVPEWLGLWWTHILVILLALMFVYAPRIVVRLRHREAAA